MKTLLVLMLMFAIVTAAHWNGGVVRQTARS